MSRPRSRPSSSRCEASSRCTPSDRPSRPIWTNRSMKSGLAGEQLAELVADHQQAGQRGQRRAGGAGPLVVARLRRSCRPRAAAPGGGPARRRCASLHAVDQRQLVGEVGDHRAGVRQRVERGERRAALEVDQHEVERPRTSASRPAPSTSVRSSSVLPEPVAPMSRPCGPMPSCADSLMSSSTGLPSGPMPIGIRSRSRGGRRRQVARGSIAAASARPSSVGQLHAAGQRLVARRRRCDSR